MALFTSTYVNRIDRKGRVSVPAPFRAALGSDGPLYLTPNPVLPALDGHDVAWLNDRLERIEALPAYSAERSAYETLIFADTATLQPDPEGRVVLPPSLIERLGVDGVVEEVTFVGLGRYFQIWHPPAFAAHREKARAAALENGLALARPAGAGR